MHCGELNRIMYKALPPFMLADIRSHHLPFLPSQNVVYFLLKHNLAIALFALIPLRNTSLLALKCVPTTDCFGSFMSLISFPCFIHDCAM